MDSYTHTKDSLYLLVLYISLPIQDVRNELFATIFYEKVMFYKIVVKWTVINTSHVLNAVFVYFRRILIDRMCSDDSIPQIPLCVSRICGYWTHTDPNLSYHRNLIMQDCHLILKSTLLEVHFYLLPSNCISWYI